MGPHPGLGGKPRQPQAGGVGWGTTLGHAEETALVLTPAPPYSICILPVCASYLPCGPPVYRRKAEACGAQLALTSTNFLSDVIPLESRPHTWKSMPGFPAASSSP